jgi:hypothetical protein
MKYSIYAKIIGAMALAFFAVNTVAPEVFIANSPKIRPGLDRAVALRINTLADEGKDLIARITSFGQKSNYEQQTQQYNAQREKLQSIPFTPVGKGVYAKSDNETTVVELRLGELDWLEYTYMINGKEVKIRVPKDVEPPKQELLEKIYK